MPKGYAPCLSCMDFDTQKKFHPFCSDACAARWAFKHVGKTVYCEKHGWAYFSGSKGVKPYCIPCKSKV